MTQVNAVVNERRRARGPLEILGAGFATIDEDASGRDSREEGYEEPCVVNHFVVAGTVHSDKGELYATCRFHDDKTARDEATSRGLVGTKEWYYPCGENTVPVGYSEIFATCRDVNGAEILDENGDPITGPLKQLRTNALKAHGLRLNEDEEISLKIKICRDSRR